MADDLRIDATPKQGRMLNELADVDEVLWGGQAGGGKSEGLLLFCLLRRIQNAGSVGLALRKTFRELDKSLIRKAKFNKVWGLYAKWNEEKKLFQFKNGSIQEFGYLETDNDLLQYQCFHPDTEILTLGGWKHMKDVKLGDLAASMNPETRIMDWKPITKLHEYQFDGELETLWNRFGAAYAVTPNHTIWASTKRVKELRQYTADSLPAAARIPQTTKWEGLMNAAPMEFASDGNNGRKICFDPETWLDFLGWYLAEGNCCEGRYEIKITQCNESGKNIIREVLSRIKGINFHENDKGFTFNNKALCLYLKQFGLSGDKFIPVEVKQIDTNHLNRLLFALIEGDGTWYSDRHGVFVSSSKKLADDVCEIAIKCGYKVAIALRNDNKPDSPYGCKPRWRVYIVKKEIDSEIHKGRGKMKYSGLVHCVTVPPYHTVLIRYAGRISWSGQSAEYDDVCFDELTHFPDNQYHYMKSRLRPRSCKKGLMRSATNPGNVGHQWVKDYFVDKARERVYKEWDEDVKRYKTRYFIPASLEDNTLMTAEQRAEYRSWLNQLPEAERRQLRDGDWDYVPGAAFAEWDSKVHVCEPMPIPEFGKVIMGFDFGFGKPFSVNWVWMDYDGRMWLFNEWYGWNGKPDQGIRMAPSGIARGILQREEQMKVRVYDRIADPSIFARTPNMKGGGQGPSIAEMMADEGVIFNPGDNDRLLGKAQLHERLKVPTDGLPMLMVYSNCHHFLRTFPVLQLDDNNIEDVQTKMEDHAYDSVRYLCMSRPIVPQLAPRDKPFMERIMEKVTRPTPKDDFGLEASIYDL